MSADIQHRCSIAITNLKFRGQVDDTISALLNHIDEMEVEADSLDLELARLTHIEEIAAEVFEYHLSGKLGADDFWDADIMVSLPDDLGDALSPSPLANIEE